MCSRVKTYLLTPRPKSVIYANNTFLTEKIRQKYQPRIDHRLQKNRDRQANTSESLNLLLEMKDVIRITKFEVRYDCVQQVWEDNKLYGNEDEVDQKHT